MTALCVDGLSVALGGREVVRDVSFVLPPAAMVAIVGPNGAGKTTLLRALAGLLPSRGDIRLGERRADTLSLRERALTFGYLPQGHVVHWSLPVRDVVALGRYPHGARDPARLSMSDSEAVTRAMEKTGIMPFADRPIDQLSGGERARVALARVLAVEAPVLLADEATASLDPYFQLQVMTILRQSAQAGTTVAFVTHDLTLASRFASHAIVLCEGRIVAAGSPQEAFTAERLADVFHIDALREVYRDEQVVVPWTAV
jgi:iron complex transport system ATP-binding protein